MVHFDKEIHLIWRYLLKSALGGHPVLSGHYSVPRGCPLNTGFTVLKLWGFLKQKALKVIPLFSALRITQHAAHNVATSKVALIFIGRLKRSSYGSFCSPSALNSNFDYSTRLKRCLCWNSPQSSRAKWSFEAEIIPLLSLCRWPPFYLCFYSLWPCTFREEEIWKVEDVLF